MIHPEGEVLLAYILQGSSYVYEMLKTEQQALREGASFESVSRKRLMQDSVSLLQ